MTTLTTNDVAAEFGTNAKTLRKFLRADAKAQGTTTPGKGSRYSLEKKDLRGMRTRFNKWQAAEAQARAERAAKVADDAKQAVDEVDAEVEPTDDELEAIDDEA